MECSIRFGAQSCEFCGKLSAFSHSIVLETQNILLNLRSLLKTKKKHNQQEDANNFLYPLKLAYMCLRSEQTKNQLKVFKF